MTDLDASLNAVNFSDVYFEVGRYFDDLIPAQKITKLDIPKNQGYRKMLKKFLPRNITILGILHANSKSQLITRIEDFTSFLYHDDAVQLIFNDKSDRYYSVEFQKKVELQKRGQFVPLKLTFIADDPFGYAVTPDSDSQTITDNNDTYILANGGQHYAYPVITITFNQIQKHVYIENNSIDGNRVDISKSFAVSDELEIDCKNETIKLNGVASYAGLGDGGDGTAQWIFLNAGNNEIQVGTDDDTINVDVDTTLEKVYF